VITAPTGSQPPNCAISVTCGADATGVPRFRPGSVTDVRGKVANSLTTSAGQTAQTAPSLIVRIIYPANARTLRVIAQFNPPGASLTSAGPPLKAVTFIVVRRHVSHPSAAGIGAKRW